MVNSDEKVSKFVEAVTAYAEEQSQRIHQEVEDFKAQRLYEAEQQALQAAYEMIQRENAGMRSNLRRDLSRRELDERRHLLEKRQGLMEDVFAGAEEKLREYTATPAYRERLRQSVSEVVGRLTEEGQVPLILYFAPQDQDKWEELRPLCPADSRLEADATIRLGGVRGENRVRGLIADDTLDQKLLLQREWFTAHSGLTIE